MFLNRGSERNSETSYLSFDKDAVIGSAVVTEASLFDAYAVSELVRNNFEKHPRYANMDLRVKADYLRANTVGDFLETMNKPGTRTFVVKTSRGIAAMILVRETGIEEVERRLSQLNGSRPAIASDQALDIRRLHTGLGYEGHGFATMLLHTAEAYAGSFAIPLLISDATGPAQGFFEKRGFAGGILRVGRQNGSEGTIFRCIKSI